MKAGLTKKIITNKNGKKQGVWVKTNEGASAGAGHIGNAFHLFQEAKTMYANEGAAKMEDWLNGYDDQEMADGAKRMFRRWVRSAGHLKGASDKAGKVGGGYVEDKDLEARELAALKKQHAKQDRTDKWYRTQSILRSALKSDFGSIAEAKKQAKAKHKGYYKKYKEWNAMSPNKQMKSKWIPNNEDLWIDKGSYKLYYLHGKHMLMGRDGAGYYMAMNTTVGNRTEYLLEDGVE